VEKFPGSKGLRDTGHGVAIDILITGEYPEDGQPKPVAFPHPSDAAVEGERFRVLALPRLVELRLASGMTAPHRLKDPADVLSSFAPQGCRPSSLPISSLTCGTSTSSSGGPRRSRIRSRRTSIRSLHESRDGP
jgi:hypothetical protein